MQVAAQQLSGDQAADLKMPTLASVAFGNSLQLPLYRAGTGKQSAIHFIESVYRCVEHEAAGDTDSDPDRAPIELDCKSLRNHDDSTPGRAAGSPDAATHPRGSCSPA
jgi:hypothetical protein